MILTVTPNPALDRMYYVDRFDFQRGHRVDTFKVTAGGKGINVTKVLDALKADVLATGFLGGTTGKQIEKKLSQTNAKLRFANIEDETRTTVSIADDTGQTFELVEQGPTIKQEELERFHRLFEGLISDASVAVFSGSLLPSLPSGFYRTCIDLAKRAGVYTMLDTSGEALKEGLKAGPDLIKPNRDELERLLGRRFETDDEIVSAARETLAMGAGAVAVSLGDEGMIYVDDDVAYRVKVPSVDIMSPVGSGDSVIAGFAFAYAQGYLMEETLAFANACGVSNAKSEAIGSIDTQDVDNLRKRMTLTKL